MFSFSVFTGNTVSGHLTVNTPSPEDQADALTLTQSAVVLARQSSEQHTSVFLRSLS